MEAITFVLLLWSVGVGYVDPVRERLTVCKIRDFKFA